MCTCACANGICTCRHMLYNFSVCLKKGGSTKPSETPLAAGLKHICIVIMFIVSPSKSLILLLVLRFVNYSLQKKQGEDINDEIDTHGKKRYMYMWYCLIGYIHMYM